MIALGLLLIFIIFAGLMFMRKIPALLALPSMAILIALLAFNVIFADRLDLPSVLGVEDTAVPSDDDLLSFDFYENLTNN